MAVLLFSWEHSGGKHHNMAKKSTITSWGYIPGKEIIIAHSLK